MENEVREHLINHLAELGMTLVRGGKLYGLEIDDNNTRDVIASLYVLYTTKTTIRNEYERKLELNV